MSWNVLVPVAEDLSDDLVTGWTARIEGSHALIPDGCVDVLWIEGGRLVVCGPETQAWSFTLPEGTEAVGVRFRPGRHATVLGLNTAEIRNRRIPVEDVFGSRVQRTIAQHIAETPRQADRVRLLQRHVRQWRDGRENKATPDRAADGVVHLLTRDIGVSVAAMAEAAGLSERQLHRRCLTAFGYGPSMLRRIVRLQKFLRLARHPAAPSDLATLATAAGYADQPHLYHDCREIAGALPRDLISRPPT